MVSGDTDTFNRLPKRGRHRSSWCRAPQPSSCSIESSRSSAKPCQGGLASFCAGKLIATRLHQNLSFWNTGVLAFLSLPQMMIIRADDC